VQPFATSAAHLSANLPTVSPPMPAAELQNLPYSPERGVTKSLGDSRSVSNDGRVWPRGVKRLASSFATRQGVTNQPTTRR
jgi:hypothetical protein